MNETTLLRYKDGVFVPPNQSSLPLTCSANIGYNTVRSDFRIGGDSCYGMYVPMEMEWFAIHNRVLTPEEAKVCLAR